MTQRDWIEFGKMFETITALSGPIALVYDGMGECCLINNGVDIHCCTEDIIHTHVKSNTLVSEWTPSPLEAIKNLYFSEILGIDKFETVDLDLSEDIIDELCRKADADGVTVDEVIIDILRSYLEEFKNAGNCNCKCNCKCK